MSAIQRPRRPRADAVRNRELILAAAVHLLAEDGPSVALDAIAKRAGVGIATLYRHFPDRSILLRHIAIDMLRQSAAVATTALARGPDAFTALTSYLHTAIDLRLGVVMPMLASRVTDDEVLYAARDESKRSLSALVKAAHDEGSLRRDIGAGDIKLLVIRMARPLPAPVTSDTNRMLSHRHAELVLGGLLRFLAVDSLPGGRPLRLDDFEAIQNGDDLVWDLTPAAGTEGRSTRNGS